MPRAPALGSLEDCSAAEVVLLGNSKTRSDLPADELAAQLGLPRARVASLTVHGSSGPVWYAVTENLVFRAGCRPRTVVAYGTLEKLLAADVAPDERVRLLAPVMSAEDPVLQRKLPGLAGGSGGWDRARQRAAALREALLGGVAAGTVGLLAQPGVSGRDLLNHASDALFGEFFAVGPAPVGPLPQPGVAPTVAPPARAQDSFLPDLAALCTAHGARLVVVQAPLRSAAEEQATLAVPRLVEGARALVAEASGAWLDLSGLPLPASAWGDDVHLGALGASRATWHVARALKGAAGDAAWLLDLPPRFEAPPPSLLVGAVRPGGSGYRRLTLDGRQPLSDEACTEHEVVRCCSPLMVTRGGEPLLHTSKAEVEQGHGWYHAEAGLLAAGGSGEFQVSLDPGRCCGGWWLYPGDRATLAQMMPPAGAATLALRLRVADAPPAGTLAVTARAGGAEVLAAEVPLATGLARWPLPVLPAGQPVEVVLATSPDASFALLTEASIGF